MHEQKDNPAIVQRGINQDAAHSAMRVAVLSVRLLDAQALAKAAQECVKSQRDLTDGPLASAYADYHEAKEAFKKDTQETRTELAALAKAYHEAVSQTEEGRTAAKAKEEIRSLKAQLRQAHADERQTLMRFVDEG